MWRLVVAIVFLVAAQRMASAASAADWDYVKLGEYTDISYFRACNPEEAARKMRDFASALAARHTQPNNFTDLVTEGCYGGPMRVQPLYEELQLRGGMSWNGIYDPASHYVFTLPNPFDFSGTPIRVPVSWVVESTRYYWANVQLQDGREGRAVVEMFSTEPGHTP